MLFGSFNFKKCTSFVKVLFFVLLQKLEGTSVELEHFERDIFSLRQELTSASGGGNRHNNGSASGGSNRHTAGLESELRQIQDRAGQLQRSRAELVRNIHYLRGTYMETLFMHS
jgi:predicted  nucleic acid-binding Zn-ribbon protein